MSERRQDPRDCREFSLNNWLQHCGERLSSLFLLANDDGLLLNKVGQGERAEMLAALASCASFTQGHATFPAHIAQEIQALSQDAHLQVRPLNAAGSKVYMVAQSKQALSEQEFKHVTHGIQRIL